MTRFLTLPVIALLAIFANNYAKADKPSQSSCKSNCCNVAECDSINIPVLIVDGVEVQNLEGLAPEDVISVNIIKDSEITKLFSPRKGGVMIIKTKSKKYLKPIIEEYDKMSEEQKKNRIPGQLLIR